MARTDPRDVARVESKTVIVTRDQRDAVPTPLGGEASQLGRWMSPEEFDKAAAQRFPGCMKGTREDDLLSFTETPYSTEQLFRDGIMSLNVPPVCLRPQAGPCT